MRILRLYWSPILEFERVSQDPRWSFYFWILCCGSLCLGFLLHPFVQQVTEMQLSQVLTAEEIREARGYSSRWRLVGVFFVPIFLLLKSSLYSGIAWALAGVVGVILEFKKAMAVVMASMTTLLAKGFVAWIVLILKGKEQIRAPIDLQPALGLDLVISVTDPFWNTVLRSMTIFEVGYVVLLATGFSVVSTIPRTASAVTALAILGVGIFTEAKMESFVSDLSRFLS